MSNNGSSKSIRRVTKKRLQFLEYLIWKSKDADKFTKKCLIFLVRKSCGLTKAVRIDFDDMDIIRGLEKTFNSVVSCNNTTHINELFHLAGSELSVNSSLSILSYKHTKSGDLLVFKPSLEEINIIAPAEPYKH